MPAAASPSSPETRAAKLSLAVAVLLLAVKAAAWLLTGSAAILSDALESIINVVAAAFAVLSVSVAAKPPDADHPYGHGNIEYYAAMLEGTLIILAAAGIIWESWGKILHPAPIPSLGEGLLLLTGAGAVNLWLGVRLVRLGRRTGSLTLTADGKHVLTDVYTSGGVLGGLGCVWLTGWLWLDGAIACLVAVNIVWTGVGLIRRSVAGFMTESDPELLGEICALLQAARDPAWIDVHRLRAWRSGRRVHVDFHLILPRDMPLADAHAEVVKAEERIRERFGPDTDVLIHADPCPEEACAACGTMPCALRGEQAVASTLIEPGTAGDPDREF